MARHEYTTCDDCGKQMEHDAPFTVERSGPIRLCDELVLHACSTACLVRLATALHGGDSV